MHQIRFWCPRPHWRAQSARQTPLTEFEGPIRRKKEMEGKGRGRKGRKWRKKGREKVASWLGALGGWGGGGGGWTPLLFVLSLTLVESW